MATINVRLKQKGYCMENNKLEAFQKEQLAITNKSYQLMQQSSSRLQIIITNLQKNCEEIMEHIKYGDLSDQELNRNLWHGLNNTDHLLRQMIIYTETSAKDISVSAEKIIATLRSLRPPL
jgi:hypothetical protein